MRCSIDDISVACGPRSRRLVLGRRYVVCHLSAKCLLSRKFQSRDLDYSRLTGRHIRNPCRSIAQRLPRRQRKQVVTSCRRHPRRPRRHPQIVFVEHPEAGSRLQPSPASSRREQQSLSRLQTADRIKNLERIKIAHNTWLPGEFGKNLLSKCADRTTRRAAFGSFVAIRFVKCL